MIVNVEAHNACDDGWNIVFCSEMFGANTRLCEEDVSGTKGGKVIIVFIIKVSFGDVVCLTLPFGVKCLKVTCEVQTVRYVN